MKTRTLLALLAAASTSLAGCYDRTCDLASLTVYWSFNGTGGALGCAAAGVTTVRVFIDGQPAEGPGTDSTYACDPYGTGVEGITYGGFYDGTYHVEVEGYAGNALVYYGSQNVTVNACDSRASLLLQPAAPSSGDLGVTYSLPGGACATPSNQSPYATTFIWYQLYDSTNALASAADLTQNFDALPCDAQNRSFTIPALPFDSYRLAGMQEVEVRGDGSYVVYSYNCLTQSFDHAAAGDTFAADPMVAQAVGGTTHCF